MKLKGFFFFFLFSFALYAQVEIPPKTIPLKELLTEIESEFDVRFSYEATLIENKECLPFVGQNTLDEKLIFLEKETHLLFKKVSERYIIIQKKIPTTNHKVCGFLVDKYSGNAIANASVWVQKKSVGTSSNQLGYFELENVNSDWNIRVDYLGYYSEQLPVFKLLSNDCKKILLTETNEELEEVLISDYLTQGLSKKNNGAIKVSPRNLGILPGLTEPDILQSLQLLPGVQSPSENASGLHIRGGTPDQNLVLFDGIKMYQSGHFFGLISSFNPYVTQKIELFRSGTSAEYGERIGGVLDISSGEEIPEFSAGFGANMIHADAFVKAPLFQNKVGLIFSARRSITDWIHTPTYENFSESVFQNTRIVSDAQNERSPLTNIENTFYFNDYNLKLVAELSADDKIVFSNLYNNNELEYEAENERFHEELSDNISIKNQGTNIKWMKTWSPKWSHEIELTSSNYTLDYEGNRLIRRQNTNNNSDEDFEKRNNVKDLGVNLQVANNLSDKTKFTSGYQLTNNRVSYLFQNQFANSPNNSVLNNDNQENISHGLFTQYQFSNENTWQVNLGLRYNYFTSVSKGYFEPRLYASNKISDTWRLKISGEIKNQVLSQIVEYRNNGLGLENDIWALATEEGIPVLKSNQVSGGLIFTKNGWNIDFEVYSKNINGLTLVTDEIVASRRKYESGLSRIQGIDLLIKKRFGDYRTWVSYTLSNTDFEYKNLNQGKSFSGTYDIPHSVVWSHTYSLDKYEFSLGYRIRSGTPYTKALGLQSDNSGNSFIVYESEINTNRLPTYQKFDFSATYKFRFSKSGKTQGKLGLSILNIFNQKNILERIYEKKIERQPAGPGNPPNEKEVYVETDKLGLGITPNISLRINF